MTAGARAPGARLRGEGRGGGGGGWGGAAGGSAGADVVLRLDELHQEVVLVLQESCDEQYQAVRRQPARVPARPHSTAASLSRTKCPSLPRRAAAAAAVRPCTHARTHSRAHARTHARTHAREGPRTRCDRGRTRIGFAATPCSRGRDRCAAAAEGPSPLSIGAALWLSHKCGTVLASVAGVSEAAAIA